MKKKKMYMLSTVLFLLCFNERSENVEPRDIQNAIISMSFGQKFLLNVCNNYQNNCLDEILWYRSSKWAKKKKKNPYRCF